MLTRNRIWSAYAVAAAADAIQWLLGPIGWMLPDQAVDLAAMAAISWAIGFHPLLLPTFILELLPIADLLPTWIGCVAIVVALRRREQSGIVSPPDPRPKGPTAPGGPRGPTGPIIDV